jgi:hypothetical protein
VTTSIPGTAVIRVSRGNFDPARFAEVERMTAETGSYLIPAISRAGRTPRLLRRRISRRVDSPREHLAERGARPANGKAQGDDRRRAQPRRGGRRRVHPDRQLPGVVAHLRSAESIGLLVLR